MNDNSTSDGIPVLNRISGTQRVASPSMPHSAVVRTEADHTVGQNLTVAALGVVYGDIGTSPLYTMKQCFTHSASVTEPRVFGVLSLIVWALTLVVTIKYVIVLMRADNRGEGGILALTVLALRAPADGSSGRGYWVWPCSLAMAC